MRIGLLADLHANRQAVEACLEALEDAGCTHHAFLGDLVGYGGDPGWVVDLVQGYAARGAVAVLGNHDQAACAGTTDTMNAQAQAAIAWTHDRLDPGQLGFLQSLPLEVEEPGRLYVHANAWAPGQWGYINSRLAASRSLAAASQRLTFCGHVHDPALYYSHPGDAAYFDPHPGVAIPLLSGRRWLAIPGSCGQPRDGNPAAACAWLDTDGDRITFLRVPYDHERAAARVREAGLPEELAQRLLTGA